MIFRQTTRRAAGFFLLIAAISVGCYCFTLRSSENRRGEAGSPVSRGMAELNELPLQERAVYLFAPIHEAALKELRELQDSQAENAASSLSEHLRADATKLAGDSQAQYKNLCDLLPDQRRDFHGAYFNCAPNPLCNSNAVKLSALEALAVLGPRARGAADTVLALALTGEYILSAKARDVLANICAPDACLPKALATLDHPAPGTMALIETLLSSAGPAAIGPMSDALKNPSEKVRGFAAEFLAREDQRRKSTEPPYEPDFDRDVMLPDEIKNLFEYKGPVPFGMTKAAFRSRHQDARCTNGKDPVREGIEAGIVDSRIRCGSCMTGRGPDQIIFRFYTFPQEQAACTLEEILFENTRKPRSDHANIIWKSFTDMVSKKLSSEYGAPGEYESTEFVSADCSYSESQKIWNRGRPYSIVLPYPTDLIVFISQKRLRREKLIEETEKNYFEEVRGTAKAKEMLAEKIKKYNLPNTTVSLCPNE